MGARASSVTALASTACVGAVTALAWAAASGDRVLRFVSVERGSAPQQGPAHPTSSFANVADRSAEDRLQRPRFHTPIDYRRFATVYVAVVRPTGGYAITIKRVTLQRRGGVDQVCVRVALAAPGPDHVVTQVKTRSWHLVEIPRKAFGGAVPNAVVARTTTGHVLYARPGARATLCR